jgi:hypothetical protein
MASNLAKLAKNPRGHNLLIATFSDGKGVVVVCSRCGHHATTNRPNELHKSACLAVGGQARFASAGAAAAYRRISLGMHPKHSKGDAKVLDPCMPLAAVVQAGREQRGPPT